MKLKGVNPIEQHIEKIVLGVMLLVFLAVIAMQFVTQPNAINDGSRRIPPDQVYAALEPQANQLQSQISDLEPRLPELQPVDLVERYNMAFADAAAGRTQLSSALGEGVNIAAAMGTRVEDIQTGGDGPVAALDVPLTSRPVAASQWATLDPYALAVVPAYEQYVPAEQPYDFASVTVETTFSGTDLQRALTGEEGGSSIPRRFWSATGLTILGLEVERQKQLPGGEWGEPEPIETPPHTPTPTAALGDEAGLLDLTELVSNAAGAFDEVVRPAFPPTIAGEEWTPPSERVATGDDSQSARIRRLERQLERARAELERVQGTARDPRGPGPGKMTQPGRPGTRGTAEREQRLRERIAELEQELKDLGVEPAQAVASRRGGRSRPQQAPLLEQESVGLWAHDLGVEPGATYRYRTRVVVNNPLFRKGAELDADDPQQQALTDDPFARGRWSDWSSPIVAGAREYFFVTGAETDENTAGAGPKATIELYKMYYGHYRKSTLSLSPADELETSLRVSGELLRFDTGLVPVEEASGLVASLQAPDAGPVPLPEGVSELPSRVTIDLNVYMLDVYRGQSSQRTAFGQELTPMRVVLRSPEGEVIVRVDLEDESSPAYALASASASGASDTPLRAPGEPAIPASAELFAPPVEP